MNEQFLSEQAKKGWVTIVCDSYDRFIRNALKEKLSRDHFETTKKWSFAGDRNDETFGAVDEFLQSEEFSSEAIKWLNRSLSDWEPPLRNQHEYAIRVIGISVEDKEFHVEIIVFVADKHIEKSTKKRPRVSKEDQEDSLETTSRVNNTVSVDGCLVVVAKRPSGSMDFALVPNDQMPDCFKHGTTIVIDDIESEETNSYTEKQISELWGLFQNKKILWGHGNSDELAEGFPKYSENPIVVTRILKINYYF